MQRSRPCTFFFTIEDKSAIVEKGDIREPGEAAAKETMQLPGHIERERERKLCAGRRGCSCPGRGRMERRREKDRKKRRRSLSRFFRKVRLRRTRRKRAVRLLVLSAAVIYLMLIDAYSELFLSVREIKESEAVLERSIETERVLELFRISIRLKNGEIVFYRERTERETADRNEQEKD